MLPNPHRSLVTVHSFCRGFEHCIANMFLIPLSMALGSDISVGEFACFVGQPLLFAGPLMAGWVVAVVGHSGQTPHPTPLPWLT